MLSKFVHNTRMNLVNRGWTHNNAILTAIMWLLFLECLLITFVVTLGSYLLGLDVYTNFKLTLVFTSLIGFILVMSGVINYFETKKI